MTDAGEPLDGVHTVGDNDALSAALGYEARGFSVIPLVAGEKRPAVKVGPFLQGAQRMTPVDIRAWWTAGPMTGSAS